MPHITIKHFPVDIGEQQEAELVAALTAAATNAFGCRAGAVSIALEPVAESEWNERVYAPEITGRRDLLIKTPDY